MKKRCINCQFCGRFTVLESGHRHSSDLDSKVRTSIKEGDISILKPTWDLECKQGIWIEKDRSVQGSILEFVNDINRKDCSDFFPFNANEPIKLSQNKVQKKKDIEKERKVNLPNIIITIVLALIIYLLGMYSEEIKNWFESF